MKLFTARVAGRAVSIAFALAAAVIPRPGGAQDSTTQPASHGKVIYSRSSDENGDTTTTTGPAAQAGGKTANEPVATDAERQAVRFTSFDMDVRLRGAEQFLAVRALITIRNGGSAPLAHIPLQISSSLNWDRVQLGGRDMPLQVAVLNSDTDHTGQLHEVAITPVTPLAPGATAQLDVSYSGKIAKNAQRLLAIGTPEENALHSDWDEIGTDFTGLRGFGNVVWYPVSSVPVILGDGARLFDEVGEHRLHLTGAQFRVKLTAEFPTGEAPTVAVINGQSLPLAITAGNEEIAGVATAELAQTTLGFEAPSLFIARRTATQATNTTIWIRPEDAPAADGWIQATAAVTPFLQSWLGKAPRSPLTILDLPDAQDAAYESGPMLAAGIRQATADALDGMLVHALAHAWMPSPRAWLSEGVAHFMSTLWLEKTDGRDKSLESLEAQRPALALAEPASPGTSSGQPMAQAFAPIYYRTKATYIFWMLRDLAGDAALGAALRAYDPNAELSDSGEFEKVMRQSAGRRDLSWFFADWVNADKGLPDLSIAKVVPQAAQAGNTLVGVTITNSGYAAVEVPVTVSTPDTAITQRVKVPARGSITPRILILGTPTRVQVNDGTVPEVQASVHTTTLGETPDPSSSSSSQPAVPQ